MNGKVVLNVPAGALTNNTVFSIDPGNGAPSSARVLDAAGVFDIEPTGTTFQVPAQLTLPLPTIPQGVSASTLTVGTVENGQWVDVPGTPVVNQANGTITTQITHLSLYAVLQPASDEPTNQDPTAAFTGPSSGTVNTALTFDASSSSDPDGDTLSYSWTFGDNSQAGTGSSVTHSYANPGNYIVELTVSDGRGGTDSDSRTVAISSQTNNSPPTANVSGPSTGTVGVPVTFTGTGSDVDPGDQLALDYSWTFGDGTTGSGANVTHTYNDARTYPVSVRVSDPHGAYNEASLSITISAPGSTNLPPTAVITGPNSGVVGGSLTFNGTSSSDPNGDTPLIYAWTVDSAPAGSTSSISRTFTTTGPHTIGLTVSDGKGGSDSDSLEVTINDVPPTNQPPTAVLTGPAAGLVNQGLTFVGTGSTDPNNDPLIYAWAVDNVALTSGAATISRSFTVAGNHEVKLTVSDGRGGSDSEILTVVISSPPNQAPTAVINGPYVGVVGQVISFSSTGSTDPEHTTLTYAWNFGDGTTSTLASPTHAYSTASTGTGFTVTLTVTDAGSPALSGSASTTATISQPAPNQLPTISTTTIPATGLLMQNILFNAVASDPDGDALTYRWNFGDGSPTKSGPKAPVLHEYNAEGPYTVTLTVEDGKGGVASASGSISIGRPAAGPIAYSRTLMIFPRQTLGANLGRYVIELDGAGVPPLQFRITTFPQHLQAEVNGSMNVVSSNSVYYQWFDALGNVLTDCRQTVGTLPAYCRSSTSSTVDLTTGILTVNPTGSPPNVAYTVEYCEKWTGTLGDSFSYTVTDATGATSAPATITITFPTNTLCNGHTL